MAATAKVLDIGLPLPRLKRPLLSVYGGAVCCGRIWFSVCVIRRSCHFFLHFLPTAANFPSHHHPCLGDSPLFTRPKDKFGDIGFFVCVFSSLKVSHCLDPSTQSLQCQKRRVGRLPMCTNGTPSLGQHNTCRRRSSALEQSVLKAFLGFLFFLIIWDGHWRCQSREKPFARRRRRRSV